MSSDSKTAAPDFRDLSLRAGLVFVPSAPIDRKQFLAGRISQLERLLDTVHAPGQHAAVYGERGVGKTSLVSVAESIVASVNGMGAVRENCQSDDTYHVLWRRAFDSVRINVERNGIGFNAEPTKAIATMAARLPPEPTPHDIVGLLRTMNASFTFIFDEFDQLQAGRIAQAFAETIKALSDHNSRAKIILVGVGDNIDQLIAAHASIERALVQIQMPRMNAAELGEIIDTRSNELGTTWQPAAAKRVVKLSQGLPHYVHRLGLFATRHALRNNSLAVTMDNVRTGMRESVVTAAQSLTNAYLKSISSQRKDSLFRPVLLACALAKADELGYFRPFAIKKPLKHVGHNLDVPAFASHLNKFASDERGHILQKLGSDRQWRYRFRDPLMQPYVIMRGIADEDVSTNAVDLALAESD